MTMNQFTDYAAAQPIVTAIGAILLLLLVNAAFIPNTGKRKARNAQERELYRAMADSEEVQARLDQLARDAADLERKAEAKRMTIARDGARKAKAHKAERETEAE